MVAEKELNILWHLYNVDSLEEKWELHYHYHVQYDSELIQRILGDDPGPPILIANDPDLLAPVRVLITEVRGLTEIPVEVKEGAFTINANQHLERLMRKSLLSDKPPTLICIGNKTNPKIKGLGQFQEVFNFEQLSPASRRALHLLDRTAKSLCYRKYIAKLNILKDESPADVLPNLGKPSVTFLAYRRSHQETAKRLYEILCDFGHSTIFKPYIDYHDMKSGHWKSQLFDEISKSDVFISLVSPDYAEPGSFGLTEYEYAKEVAGVKGWDDFFNPIVIGEPGTKAGKELKDNFNALLVKTQEEISLDNNELIHWLSKVAVTGFSRDSM